MGRVGKPPIHDVLRLARTLSISTAELEAAVMGEQSPRAPADSSPAPAPPGAIHLLERAIALLEWTEVAAAGA